VERILTRGNTYDHIGIGVHPITIELDQFALRMGLRRDNRCAVFVAKLPMDDLRALPENVLSSAIADQIDQFLVKLSNILCKHTSNKSTDWFET
jgi:hypothetical protein